MPPPHLAWPSFRASFLSIHFALLSSTSLAQVNEDVSVPIVKVYASITGDDDKPETGLRKENFTVMEDGTPQEIVYFSQDVLPLNVAIVVDCSLSMQDSMEDARQAALDFVHKLNADDQALAIGFGDSVRVATELTADRTPLAKAIASMYAHGGTALYDALHLAVLALRGEERKSAIVLLSDGKDEAWGGGRPGSKKTYEEIAEEIAHTRIALYPICFWRGGTTMEYDVERKHLLKDIFEELARVSGGRCVYTREGRGLAGSFLSILQELRTQYNLYYTPSNRSLDGRWRDISVVVDRPVRKLLYRQGYYATR